MDEKKLRLIKLLEHWAEHNDEHAERYRESVVEAEDMGLITASKEIRKAQLKAGEVSLHLRNALNEIQEGDS